MLSGAQFSGNTHLSTDSPLRGQEVSDAVFFIYTIKTWLVLKRHTFEKQKGHLQDNIHVIGSLPLNLEHPIYSTQAMSTASL